MARTIEDEAISKSATQVKALSSGVSGTVLDDLSGTYKTFVEAIKEMISNAYDADARGVYLTFREDLASLEIRDDGAGMNPKQFVREYIRVGRSTDAKQYSPSGARARIGGKGIGSLAPARYCEKLIVKTKSCVPLMESVSILVPEDGKVPLHHMFPYLIIDPTLLSLFTSISYVDNTNSAETVEVEPALVLDLPPGQECKVSYVFAAHEVWLEAEIGFVRLRRLGESINLDQVAELWDLKLVRCEPQEKSESGTTLIMEGLEEFVVSDLRAPGKPQARNISSKSGIDRFIWTLGRLCPVPVTNVRNELQEKLPENVVELLKSGDKLSVYVSLPGTFRSDRISRDVYLPHRPLRGVDAALCQEIHFTDHELGLTVRGYVIGSSTIIYPAELRGISIRVKGVELGAPMLFGAEGLVSGPQHTALTNYITGELHLDGVDVRRDILPGREGLYPESPVYKALRRILVGPDDRLGGVLRDLVDEILLRSEANASAQGLVKKLELQRRALLDAASAIATMAETDEYMLERLMSPSEDELQLLLYKDVEVRPEGRLQAFTIEYSDRLRGQQFEVDYEGRRLILPQTAPYLERTVDIAGERFTVILKQAAKERVFCEVDPYGRYIFINWDHPVRGAMGDAAFIKHCLAAVVCGLPQAALNRYVQLISTRS